jgi:hypothetical protein
MTVASIPDPWNNPEAPAWEVAELAADEAPEAAELARDETLDAPEAALLVAEEPAPVVLAREVVEPPAAAPDDPEVALEDWEVEDAPEDAPAPEVAEADEDIAVVVAELEAGAVEDAGAAVAAQEQTALAADWTCNALATPQALMTQACALLAMADDWELEHWQAKSV